MPPIGLAAGPQIYAFPEVVFDDGTSLPEETLTVIEGNMVMQYFF